MEFVFALDNSVYHCGARLTEGERCDRESWQWEDEWERYKGSKEVEWVSREVGRVSREVGRLSREVGIVSWVVGSEE